VRLGKDNMGDMILTYAYRLLPTKAQHRAMAGILEDQRLLYNAALEERIGAFRRAGLSRSYIDQCKALTEWRRSDEAATALPANLQRWTLRRLDDAYRAYFGRMKSGAKPGFPRFRGAGRFRTFGFAEFSGIRFQNGRLRFKGLPGSLRVHLHRPIPEGAVILSCAFTRKDIAWQVGFAIKLAEVPLRRGNRAVGIDLGITKLAALSDGGYIPSLKAARRAERQLRVLQRALTRKSRGSAGRRKAVSSVRRCHAAIARVRANHLHQAAARLVRDYDVVAIERLNLRALTRGVLAKEVRDASWGKFISMLRYKAECAGSRVIEVDCRGSSQDCSSCGTRVSKEFRQRIHECPSCGLVIDRDLNAARNVLNRAGVGPSLLNVAGCGMRAGGNLG
jgi:putative transposase